MNILVADLLRVMRNISPLTAEEARTKPVKRLQSSYGTKPRIQLNDAFAEAADIQEFIATERESHDEKEIPYMTVSIKADEEVKMGTVIDVKQELRKANALKINYSTRKGTY